MTPELLAAIRAEARRIVDALEFDLGVDCLSFNDETAEVAVAQERAGYWVTASVFVSAQEIFNQGVLQEVGMLLEPLPADAAPKPELQGPYAEQYAVVMAALDELRTIARIALHSGDVSFPAAAAGIRLEGAVDLIKEVAPAVS